MRGAYNVNNENDKASIWVTAQGREKVPPKYVQGPSWPASSLPRRPGPTPASRDSDVPLDCALDRRTWLRRPGLAVLFPKAFTIP